MFYDHAQQMDSLVHRCLCMEMTEVGEFNSFVRLERDSMLRLAVLMVGSVAEAEEAVQDAFAAVSARWETLENPGGYLRTSVVNSCRQIIRRRDTARRASPSPAGPTWQATTIEMHDALFSLSDRQRIAIVLRYFMDWNDQEIADSLQCRPATVRSLLRRGLNQLRKDLRHD